MYVLWFQKKSLSLLVALIYSSQKKKKIARKNILDFKTPGNLVDAESIFLVRGLLEEAFSSLVSNVCMINE
jgi:hypothetical protein